MPIGWTEERYKDKLRAFFLDIEWISPKDNESKLIMIPIIQMLAEYFQNSTKQKQHLDRERTSVFVSAQIANEDDTTEFSYTFFKMQGAKELIAVSKTLASSDFFLVPSITSSKSIYLANLDTAMYNAVKRILARVRGKDLTCVSDENTAKEDDPAWTIACHLPLIYENKFGLMSSGRMEIALEDVIFEKRHQLKDLKSWTCGQLIAAVFEDADVKHYFKQVSSFFKEALDEFGAIKNSPDGIQHILFYSRYCNSDGDVSTGQDYSDYIKQALIDESIIQPGKDFDGINLYSNAQFAMQQPYKMIQIANAVLPPVIVNDNKQQNDSLIQTCKHADNLIAPNSFYVQANVTEAQISFILNKVVELPSSETGIGLFTIQERSVKMQDIAETALHILWDHCQSMANLEEQQHTLFKRCQDHDTMAFSSSHYKEFKKNARKLIDLWFATEDTFSGDGSLDAYHLVSVDQQCTCALHLSQRLLLEVGLKPAIVSIATTITSALFSNDFFGLYQLSALIFRKNLEAIKNLYFSYAIDQILKQALKGFLQIHHNRLLLLFYDKHSNDNTSQYLGRGHYSQIPSMAYTFRVELRPIKTQTITVGLLEDGVCKRVPLTPVEHDRGREPLFMFTHPGLTKEEDIPLEGICFTFHIQGCSSLSIETYVSGHPERSTHQHLVGRMPHHFSTEQKLCSPVTFKILPEHYSSIIKCVASFSLASSPEYSEFIQSDMSRQSNGEHNVFEVKRSINVVERLFLKKQLYE
ncbi:uncharacterized protein ATC70_004026 [Mucor velutinosus]|uniref:Uncharacterized protein n=1 Tax=Mucor velutinosus TaxID=708070 RepID=A0AAN7DPX2_9FUNG|nr:hypothetical protein ATC70_004026 [Mucor velutinosus]